MGRGGRSHPQLGSEDRWTPFLPSGLQACQLALSTRTVWARCPNGDLARRYGVSDKNPAGDYWKRIPGSAMCLTGRCQLCAAGLHRALASRGLSVGLSQRLLPRDSRPEGATLGYT